MKSDPNAASHRVIASTLSKQCRELDEQSRQLRGQAEEIEKIANAHWNALNEMKQATKALRVELDRLNECLQARRDAVARRWLLRQEFREARALLASAAPMPIAGRAKGIRTESLQRSQELTRCWHERSAPIPSGCGGPGIYGLFRGAELVYVGQAVNVAARIAQHFRNKHFDRASYVPVAIERLNRVEGLLIDVLAPSLNQCARAKRRRLEVETNSGMQSKEGT